MNIGELCTRTVVIAEPDLPVLDAARRMRDHHVGDLVVVDRVGGKHKPIGILTDRDLVLEVLADNHEWAGSLLTGEIMSHRLVTAREDEDVASVLSTMQTHGIRRIPVVDDQGNLVGIFTHDDLLEWLAEELGGLVAVVDHERTVEARRRGHPILS